ncbi:MAG: HAD family hydrolase [Patescibacteria group bacterium]
MQNIKAVLFDFDGTLVHSIDLLVDIFAECLQEQAINSVDSGQIRRLIGEPIDQIFDKLAEHLSPAERSKLDHAALEKSFREKEDLRNSAENIHAIEDTRGTLEFLKKQKVKLAVVSTKIVTRVEKLTDELELTHFFDLIVGRDLIENPKPNPEPVLYACEKLNVKPSETLFVGDSLLDLGAAKAAKVTFIGVLTGVCNRKCFEEHKADYIFSHVGEVGSLVEKLR